ncbi:MAG: energy transducer TonB [Candidatus Marinimicrobia bacterium]|nr:energy transducer TonB [Candidatus Neomarinimicrobiota bacterium]
MIRINPKFSLKLRYGFLLRIGLVTVLLLLIIILIAFPRFKQTALANKSPELPPDFLPPLPPIANNIDTPKPPERPAIPVPSFTEDFIDDVPNLPMNFEDYIPLNYPPEPPEPIESGTNRREIFIPYDEAPEPIGGIQSILENVKYPPMAIDAQIQGTVFVRAFINERGIVTECKVVRGIPNTGLDEAACAAVFKTKFKPAKQRDKNVGVYMSIPIVFKIKDS